jgi:metal-sulfur cluster biosynthetic enzyme
MLNEDAVRHVLSGINDPELKKPLTELDMVRFVNIEDGNVTVGITLTVPGCPLKDKITADIQTSVSLIEGVSSVAVEYDVMSDVQREKLKKKLGLSSAPGANGAPAVSFAKRSPPALPTWRQLCRVWDTKSVYSMPTCTGFRYRECWACRGSRRR